MARQIWKLNRAEKGTVTVGKGRSPGFVIWHMFCNQYLTVLNQFLLGNKSTVFNKKVSMTQ